MARDLTPLKQEIAHLSVEKKCSKPSGQALTPPPHNAHMETTHFKKGLSLPCNGQYPLKCGFSGHPTPFLIDNFIRKGGKKGYPTPHIPNLTEMQTFLGLNNLIFPFSVKFCKEAGEGEIMYPPNLRTVL